MKKKGKQLSTKKLLKAALTKKPKWKPSKGYVYLATINEGELFETEFNKRGVLIEKSVNAKVVWTDNMEKTSISMNTEVKVVGD